MEAPVGSIPAAHLPIDTPPGPDANLSDDIDPRVVGVAAFLFAISFIVVSLRFVGRYLSKAGIWWDDWLCLAAMLVSWGTCILCFVSVNYNFGKHEASLSLVDAITDTQDFFKALYAYETLYTIAITLAKFSIILFYARIFTERSFQIVLWAVGAVVGAFYIACQIVQLVQCRPLSALWDGSYADNCIDIIQFFVVAGAVNSIINFVLLILPLPMIWGLEIRLQAKIGLSVTFMLGIFVFAVSVARIAIIRQLKEVDVTWSYVDAAVWTTVEPNIAVVSASLPILRSLWVLLSPGRRTQTGTHPSRSWHNDKAGRAGPAAGTGPTGILEKQVTFTDSAVGSPVEDDRTHSLFRGVSTRTKSSAHPNTPASSRFSKPENYELVSPVHDGGYLSPGGISDITGPPTAGLHARPNLMRNTTIGGRSDDSAAPLTANASELSAHKSIPYGSADFARYTVNISSGSSRNPSEKPSIASRMGMTSPRLGGLGKGVGGSGSSPRTGANSRRSSVSDGASIEMNSLPIQGSLRGSPSPPLKGPMQIEIAGRNRTPTASGSASRSASHSTRGGARYGRDSGSLTGYPPVAELYA